MRTFRISLNLIIVLACGLFTACKRELAAQENGRLNVLATTGMVGDVVRAIGGEDVDVQMLMGAGVDPHLYKPTAADVKKLQAADIVFYNGLLLEGKMTDLFVKVARNGKPVIAVTDGLALKNYVLHTTESHDDPHVWMDVAGWIHAANAISTALEKHLPEKSTEIQKRRDAYLTELQKLDDYARKSLASVPTEKRVLVTAHDAFGYMARAYGLEVKSIQGISTESEAGLKDINSLVNFLVDKKIPAVFVESSVPRKSVEALVEGTKARGHAVSIGGELFSDAMGVAGTYEGTYVGMIDHNVTLITRALGGSAPEKGMNGKLK